MSSLLHRAIVVAVGLALVGGAAGCDSSSSTPAATTATTTTAATTTAPSAASCAKAGLPKTVAYRSIPGIPADALSLDIHAPARACLAPVILWVHGGGYQIGDKAKQMPDKVALFNAKGWILVSINYRLTQPGVATSAQFPDHYEDVAAAIGWVHRSIDAYGGDPNRLALLGHSAGADIVANVADQPTYLAAEGLRTTDLDCIGPLDTEGFDKVTSVGDGESAQWKTALGNEPDYLTTTSATRFIERDDDVPDTIGVVRGGADRRAIEQAYLDKVASTGARAVTIDAAGLSHEDVNTRIGAPGDTVMTPPLVAFLSDCLGPAPKPTNR